MHFNIKTALPLTFVTVMLSLMLVFKTYLLIRSNLIWRVNCWFCNTNCWVKFLERNCWTCPSCEQYNGFTKDGDYNRTVQMGSELKRTPTVFAKTPPSNGLCKMCNVNQQLKVTLLANFVPTSEKNFDNEIEFYRVQLEKAYKLCSPCRKILVTKLHKEKENLLEMKLLEERKPGKNQSKANSKNIFINKLISKTSAYLGIVLLILVLIELYQNLKEKYMFSIRLNNIINIISDLTERLFIILSLKVKNAFPALHYYFTDLNILLPEFLKVTNNLTSNEFHEINALMQEALGGFVCFIQIIGHIFKTNKTKYSILSDSLWIIFEIASITQYCKTITNAMLLTIIKFLCLCLILVEYKIKQVNSVKNVKKNSVWVTPYKNKLKNPFNLKKIVHDSDESFAMETDDDVSLCKFGLQNLSDSSADTNSPFNNSFNGRSFSPRSESLWSKPKLNSTFCVNSLTTKSPSCISETIFAKPSFDKYQKLQKDDSDSDLDESISSLTIGTQKKSSHKNNAMFSLRKFTATPNFVTPTPLNRSRPLISPSKLGHNTSWVAGGYWGSDGEHQIFNVNGSRSSSQSSGFESQASSMNQRNMFTQTSSREESVCGDNDRSTMLLDPFQGCNINNLPGYMPPQTSFSPISSPIFPQMQYNNHVQIPQPTVAQQRNISHNVFRKPSFVQSTVFRAPVGSGLIDLSRVNSITH